MSKDREANGAPEFSGARMMAARNALGLSLEGLRAALEPLGWHPSKQYLSGLEHGKNKPGYGRVLLVSRVLKQSMEWFSSDCRDPVS